MAKIGVLIIDDSLTIRAIIEQALLNDPDFAIVGTAASADEARELLKTVRHQVVTLDLAMPGTHGLKFLDELRAGRHAPVVVVSSSTKPGSEAAAEALASGAIYCFDKANILGDVRGFRKILRRAAAQHQP